MSNDKMDVVVQLLKEVKDLLMDYASTVDSLDKRLAKLEEKLNKSKSPGEVIEDSLDVEDIKKKLSEISDKLERVRKSLYWHRVSTEKNQSTTGRKGYRKYRGSRVSRQ